MIAHRISSNVPRLYGPHHRQVDHHRVADDEVDEADPEQPDREELLEHLGRDEDREDRHHVERQHPEERRRRPADQQREAQEAAQPDLRDQLPRPAGVHERGLHVALDPAAALTDEVRDRGVGLLHGRRVHDADAVAERTGADAEVGVLGHVVRDPSRPARSAPRCGSGSRCRPAGSAGRRHPARPACSRTSTSTRA